MKRTIAVVVAVLVSGALMVGFFVGKSTAAGGLKSYGAVLNVGQQVPVNPEVDPDEDGIGVAHFSFNPATREICTNMTVVGLDGGAIVSAHIHGAARAGANAPPVVPLAAETDGVWENDCGDGPLTKAEVEDLNKGRLYVNVHTTAFQDGEVRGQIFK